MTFGLTIEKLMMIAAIAAIIIGPERLPRYAEGLARFTTQARSYLRSVTTRVNEEIGEDFDDIDWRTLDPRRYDPRRIIREALLDPPAPDIRTATEPTGAPAETTARVGPAEAGSGPTIGQ